ncbi:MAG: carbon starvation protein A [Lachnospiraceae bacterium]|nr:carbon starvation protein A [Lachnospiraceae bacterium]
MALIIILAAAVLLFLGYIFYGSWLAKKWGIDPKRDTPAVTEKDGVDYVAAKPAVLMGHHFSSIAGAGPINGPIQASVFGWVPVFLWCVIGGIFFGGLQDFGCLFASIRNKGKSVGEIVSSTMGRKAKRLFIIFALLVLVLCSSSFINIIAGTFMTDADDPSFGFVLNPTSNQTTAMISVLFIVLAVIYGFATNRFNLKTGPATIVGLLGVAGVIFLGLNVGFAMSRTAWIVFVAVYVVIASLVPVWILLQPRDYLSSFLLYAMMALAIAGIIFQTVSGTPNAEFSIPAFAGFDSDIGPLFPFLFITVACGACSGFHSLIATGTTSKQLDSEQHAKAIGYGSMLVESGLAIISLIAVGMVYQRYLSGGFGSPSSAFGAGIAIMFGAENTAAYQTIYALLTLAVSVFALTTLDSGARLVRYLCTELFLKDGESSYRDAKGIRKVFAHPLTGTLIVVATSSVLGMLSLGKLWSLFGSANQLLAGIALLAVCAWLGNIQKNNKMFFIPMCFMLIMTLTALVITVVKKLPVIAGGAADYGDFFQLIFSLAMIVLAVFLAVEGIKTLSAQIRQKKEKA